MVEPRDGAIYFCAAHFSFWRLFGARLAAGSAFDWESRFKFCVCFGKYIGLAASEAVAAAAAASSAVAVSCLWHRTEADILGLSFVLIFQAIRVKNNQKR